MGTIIGGVDSAAESGGPERSPSGVRRSPSESGGTPPNIFSGGVPPSAAVFRRTPLGSERSSAGLSESAAESALIRGGTADLPPRTTPPADSAGLGLGLGLGFGLGLGLGLRVRVRIGVSVRIRVTV